MGAGRWRSRFASEKGAVLLIIAMVMLPLMIITAGGIGMFTLYGAHREMQKAADQAALAGAAALPPFNPDVALETLPFPMPDTDPVYELTGLKELDIPRIDELVPDPRAVACTYGADSLSGNSASLVTAFGSAPTSAPPTICADIRVAPSMQSNPVAECLNHVVSTLRTRLEILGTDPLLAPLLPDVLTAVLTPTQSLVDALNQAVPAALSPTMRVQITSALRPPLAEIVTGDQGLEFKSEAIAARRLKNAVVLPVVPGGSVEQVATDDVNLNSALAQSQPTLIQTLADIDSQLNSLTSGLGLPDCQNLLQGVSQDLSDIYDPPSGPAPSAVDLIAESVAAAEAAAAETGIPVSELAGDAYYAIGAGEPVGSVGSIVSDVVGPVLAPLALSLLGPITAAQIPTLDVAIVVFTDIGNQDFRATVIDAANARGLFRAVLLS